MNSKLKIDYVVYGKIIIDDIRLLSGKVIRGVLGGGGPQGAFGARVWDPSVGILTRSGVDIEECPRKMLESIGIDLSGWIKYEQHSTPHGFMEYEENEYMVMNNDNQKRLAELQNKFNLLLKEVIPIPDSYRTPKVIHLITEYTNEPMANKALQMKAEGSIYSLEPIIDYHNWSNKNEMLSYFPNVDVVTPDWPSASGIANTNSPLEVLKYWSKLGPSLVAVRHGIHGSYVWDKLHDQMWHIPIVKVNAIDPTGCGNSYGGGLSVGWEKTHDAKVAGCYGTVSASYLVKTVGIPPVTPELEVEARKIMSNLLEQVEKM